MLKILSIINNVRKIFEYVKHKSSSHVIFFLKIKKKKSKMKNIQQKLN